MRQCVANCVAKATISMSRMEGGESIFNIKQSLTEIFLCEKMVPGGRHHCPKFTLFFSVT